MKRGPRLLFWPLLLVWGAWAFGLQGWLAGPLLGPYTPELGLVLLVVLGPSLGSRATLAAAACLACLRVGFSSDPPLAVLVGYCAAAGVAGWLGASLEVDRPVPRGLLAGALAAGLAFYLGLAGRAELVAAGQLGSGSFLPDPGLAWRSALATAAAATLLAPLLRRLPGLSPGLSAGSSGGRAILQGDFLGRRPR